MDGSLKREAFERAIALLTAELRLVYPWGHKDPTKDFYKEKLARAYIEDIDAKLLHRPVLAPTGRLATRRLAVWYKETEVSASKSPGSNTVDACSLRTSERVSRAEGSASQPPREAETAAAAEAMAIIPDERRFERIPVANASDQALLLSWAQLTSNERDEVVRWQLRATQRMCELFAEMRRLKRALDTNNSKRVDRLEALMTGSVCEDAMAHDRELDGLEEEEERLVGELDAMRSLEAHLRALCESVLGVGLVLLQPGKFARMLFLQQERQRLRREVAARFG